MMKNTSFPLLYFNKENNELGLFLKENDLTFLPEKAVDFLVGLTLVTSEGIQYIIKQAYPEPSKSRFSLLSFFKPQNVKMNLQLVKVEDKIDISILKAIITQIMDDELGIWDADGQLFHTLDLVKKSNTINDLIHILASKIYPPPIN